MDRLVTLVGGLQTNFIDLMRIAICVVMVWIGGLKAFQYEADGIVPFVANSPFMGFFYKHASDPVITEEGKHVKAYTLYKNPEGRTVQKHIDWHRANGTYLFSYGLGAVIIGIGILVLMGIWFPKTGFWGGMLTFGMAIVTLSFLITTPETFVPKLDGDFDTPHHGFPYLSGAGRLVLKDIIMLAGGLIVAADSAKKLISKRQYG